MAPSKKPSLILTPKQREFLIGDLDLDDDHVRSMRSKIRKRVEGSLSDFKLLYDMAQDDLLRDEIGDMQTLAPLVQFAYLALDRDTEAMEDIIEYSIDWGDNNAKDAEGYLTSVDVDIETNRDPFTNTVKERFEAGEELSDLEVGILIRHGPDIGVDPEEVIREV